MPGTAATYSSSSAKSAASPGSSVPRQALTFCPSKVISLTPCPASSATSVSTSSSGRDTSSPRVYGTTQKVQYLLQPSMMETKALAPSTRAGGRQSNFSISGNEMSICGAPQIDISFPEIEKFDCLPPARVEGASAFVSIMEGCSKYCTFCVVPYTRGEEVSRPLDGVLTEVAELAEQGVSEITLLGQNVNAWRGTLEPGDAADFALLLEYVAAVPGIERLRYTTSHPKEFTPRLIEAYPRIPQLASHVHLPVQTGSDRMLAAMKRGYTV